jgi:hypothetical protein
MNRETFDTQRNNIDSSQFPDYVEFLVEPDVETVVQLKEGFVFRVQEFRLGNWRFRVDGEELVQEYLQSGVWLEQARYSNS